MDEIILSEGQEAEQPLEVSSRCTKLELEKRIRTVAEWILEDWSQIDLVTSITVKFNIDERQARRYIARARELWAQDEDEAIEQKRKIKIKALQKMKRNIDPAHKNTPQGIRAQLAVDKLIIELENLMPAKKLELSGPNGGPIQTENVGKVLFYIPSNGRDNIC